MKKLLFVVLAIPFLLFGIVNAQTTNVVLKNVWSQRPDLQTVFPDGFQGNGWTLNNWAVNHGWKENKHLKQFNPQYEKDYIYEKYLPLERALDEIASKRYDYDNYFCVQFTNDLEKELIEKDISSIKIIGSEPKSSAQGNLHEWIAIMFEPISGDIIKVSEQYEVIRIEE